MTNALKNLIASALPLVGMIVCFSSVQGQMFRSSLYPKNWRPPSHKVEFESEKIIQDFSYAGYHSGEKEIPNVEGPQFNVVSFGADSSGRNDSTSSIQKAIVACENAGGGIVFLPEGLYQVSLPAGKEEVLCVSKSNVVFRGAGVDQTKILNTTDNMRKKVLISIGVRESYSIGKTQKLTCDHLGPTRRIFVENAGNYRVGNLVKIRWDITDKWIGEHGQQQFWGNGRGKLRPDAGVMQRIITKVNEDENTVEVNAPIRYYLKTRDNARLESIPTAVTECGIENMSLGDRQINQDGWDVLDYRNPDKGAYKAHDATMIELRGCHNCWVRNVRSYQPESNSFGCHIRSRGIRLEESFNCSVIDCRFERPQYGGAGGNGYMYTATSSCENLFDNCTANFSRHGFTLLLMGTSGNVFFRCRDEESQRATGNTGSYVTDSEGSDTHQYLSSSNLFDSCSFNNSLIKLFHRNTVSRNAALTGAHNTVWNFEGKGNRFETTVKTDQGRYGYVIGTKGPSSKITTNQSRYMRGHFPKDHVEAIGNGANLRPQSLYLDQKKRRLER